MVEHKRGRFAHDLLRGIGGCTPVGTNVRKTRRRTIALLAWMRAESGSLPSTGEPGQGAENNPLGSTWPPHYPAYNSVDVRNYPDFMTGVLETLNTMDLTGHHYEEIKDAIRSARPSALSAAVEASDWGTGAGVSRGVIDYVKRHYREEFERPVGAQP